MGVCVHMYNLFISKKCWLNDAQEKTSPSVMSCGNKNVWILPWSSFPHHAVSTVGPWGSYHRGGFTSLLPKGGRLKWVQAPGLAKGDRDMEFHCPQINLSAASKGCLPVKAQMPSVQAWETTLVGLKENQKPL